MWTLNDKSIRMLINMKNTQPNLLTLQEVAKELRVNPRTVFRLIKGENTTGKKLPAVMVGHSWRIRRVDFDNFLIENLNLYMPTKKKVTKRKK
jgi:excisionase family DNA binding protein